MVQKRPYIQKVHNTLVKLFITYGGSVTPSMNETTLTSSTIVETCSSLCDFDRWCNESRLSVNRKSELDSYLDEVRFPRAHTFNILDWWRTNSHKLPILAKIARDSLAIPATTMASKATFSIGGRVIDESHACLLSDVVEALIVAADWIGPIPKDVGRDAESYEVQVESVARF